MNGCAVAVAAAAPPPPLPLAGAQPQPPRPTPPQPSDRFHMELLMEKLRTKNSQYKNLTETSKAVRMTMLDKRWALDSTDRGILQRCLDSLQHHIKVCSLQSLVERLECLSRQLGLKFTVGGSGVDLFISSDMFYLEIILEPTGSVKDVKIHHEGENERQSCEELVSCITRGDFADFTAQLEGLTALYQLNAQKAVKCKAFTALSAIEADIGTLYILQSCINDTWMQIHKTPIGLVHKRRGGHALRLTYFISRYEIAVLPGGVLSTEAIDKGAGHSVLLLIETASAHRLQLTPLVTLPQRLQPNYCPVYAQLGPNNSATLPARFILKLSNPMPICGSLIKIMNSAAESEGSHVMSPNQSTPFLNSMKPLLSLVVQHVAPNTNPNKGLFVNLPDQCQCYFITETNGLDGCVVESIPFTHPRHVPTLIACLRQQALFNSLISSCVRPNSKQDIEAAIMVEVNALSWKHITVSLEQPGDNGMATIEIQLPESGCSPCISVQGGTGNNDIYEEYLTQILQCTLSIPITVRALLSRWEKDSRPGFSGGAGGLDSDGPSASPRPHYASHSNQNNFLNETHQNIQLFNTQDGNLNSIIGNNTLNTQDPNLPLQNISVSNEDKKVSKKRKSENNLGNPSKKNKPELVCEVFLESSSSDLETSAESEIEENDPNIQSNSSNDDDEENQPSPSSQADFASDLELSGLDPSELLGGSSNDNKTSGSEFENSMSGEANDLHEIDDTIRASSSTFEKKKYKQKSREYQDQHVNKLSNSSLLMDLEGSSYVPPSVSITPITSSSSLTRPLSPNFSSALTSMGLDKRPGIEIIPISSSQQPSLSSSLTITPIPSTQSKIHDNKNETEIKSVLSKHSQLSSINRTKEKKKKRHREEFMGPPDKLPPKQDPLTKPVSVSIKPAERAHSPSPVLMRSTSPNTIIRKFSPSPTHGRSVSITKSTGSPNSLKNLGKSSGTSSHHSSPRNSPIQYSPKHSLTGYSSPKSHGISSPKNNSASGSSGKPSMSTLKSATSSSPSGKSSSSSHYDISKISKMSSKDNSPISISTSNKDKEKKSGNTSHSTSSGNSSPKLKSSSVKLKQLDISISIADTQLTPGNESVISPIVDLGKSSSINQIRNRKGSLSAVIDKLKSAQHYGSESDISGKSSSNNGNKDRSSSSSSKTSDFKISGNNNNSKLSEASKTQEYMVKPSLDGMRITINKTKTKDSSGSNSCKSSSSNSNSSLGSNSTKQTTSIHSVSTGSPKTHTGLKPGVISGPASKKPHVLQSSKSGISLSSPGLVTQSSSSSKSANSSNILSGNSKVIFQKSSSNSSISGSGLSKISKTSTGSPKMSISTSDLSKLNKEREKLRNKSGNLGNLSDKSIFSPSKTEKRLSPASIRDESDERHFKSLGKEQNFIVESLTKNFDTSKYQIPKLSARILQDENNKSKSSTATEKNSTQISSAHSDISRNVNSDSASKLLDYMGRSQELLGSKYSFQQLANSKTSDQLQKSPSSAMSTTKTVTSFGSTSPVQSKIQTNPMPLLTNSKLSDSVDNSQSNFSFGSISKSSDSSKDMKMMDSRVSTLHSHQFGSISRDETSVSKADYSKSFPPITMCNNENIKQTESGNNKMFASSASKTSSDDSSKKLQSSDNISSSFLKSHSVTGHDTDLLLDFSSCSSSKSIDTKNKLMAMVDRAYSVNTVQGNIRTPLSVHSNKSPITSPLVILSPHSNSPCITDDDLMDEAVVSSGK